MLLTLQAHNPEQEEAEEELEVDYAGEEVEIGFNVNYLLDALAAVDGGEVELGLTDANNSCLLERRLDAAGQVRRHADAALRPQPHGADTRSTSRTFAASSARTWSSISAATGIVGQNALRQDQPARGDLLPGARPLVPDAISATSSSAAELTFFASSVESRRPRGQLVAGVEYGQAGTRGAARRTGRLRHR